MNAQPNPPASPPTFWVHAAAHPDALAVVDPDGTPHTAGAILAEANRLVYGLRALGLQTGDAVAFVLSNRAEVLSLFMAAHQAGWFLTPINHHLTAPEMAYILTDSGARAVVTEARFGGLTAAAADSASVSAQARFSVDEAAGFRPLAALTVGQPDTTPPERRAGATMTYTSGTTGKPKGVRRATMSLPPELVGSSQAMFLALFGITAAQPGTHLVVAPLYHTAVLNFTTNFLHLGHPAVLMDRWTPEGMLDRIQRYRVTSTHMVPTQFVRLLKLPEAERSGRDLSSMSHMIHGAAPCPVDVKHQMLAWWGDCIYEYYAATEGGGTLIGPAEWRRKPGSVGKAWPISEISIRDDSGMELPRGTTGTVWIRMGDYRFEYHKDESKTGEAWKGNFFTVGDAGYLDEEGYLTLCDRKADMIISGGVNLYPAEIESVLIGHPAVLDVAVFGVADEDWGEQVRAVVQPAEGVIAGPALEAEIFAWCEGRLARFKLPRTIRFTDALPRDPNGKLYKRKLREQFG